jgi:hypothetical protein
MCENEAVCNRWYLPTQTVGTVFIITLEAAVHQFLALKLMQDVMEIVHILESVYVRGFGVRLYGKQYNTHIIIVIYNV